MSSSLRILLVCSGNTCRSPLASAMLAGRLRALAEFTKVTVESAGTSASPGAPASEGSALMARERGLDLAPHRARLLTADLVQAADLILAMGHSHLSRIAQLGGGEKAQLLTAYVGEAGIDVADPFGSDLARYRDTAAQLDRIVAAVVVRLQRERAA